MGGPIVIFGCVQWGPSAPASNSNLQPEQLNLQPLSISSPTTTKLRWRKCEFDYRCHFFSLSIWPPLCPKLKFDRQSNQCRLWMLCFMHFSLLDWKLVFLYSHWRQSDALWRQVLGKTKFFPLGWQIDKKVRSVKTSKSKENKTSKFKENKTKWNVHFSVIFKDKLWEVRNVVCGWKGQPNVWCQALAQPCSTPSRTYHHLYKGGRGAQEFSLSSTADSHTQVPRYPFSFSWVSWTTLLA